MFYTRELLPDCFIITKLIIEILQILNVACLYRIYYVDYINGIQVNPFADICTDQPIL